MSDANASYHGRVWFSRQHPDATNFTKPDHYSSAFWREVLQIRQKYHLTTTSFGIDVLTDTQNAWHLVEITNFDLRLDKELVAVAASRFEWNHVYASKVETCSHSPVPHFRLRMHIARPTMARKRMGHPTLPANIIPPPEFTVVHSYWLTIEFHSKHPALEPSLFIAGRRESLNTHTHHWFENGKLCVYYRGDVWHNKGHSTVQWINLAIAWNVWHVEEFGF